VKNSGKTTEKQRKNNGKTAEKQRKNNGKTTEKQRKNSGKTASRNSAKQRDSSEVILRFRELSPEGQRAVIEFLKQL